MKKNKRDFLNLAAKYRDAAINPPCAHFSECGGCVLQDVSYENQLLLKGEQLNALFDGICRIDRVMPSRPLGYRNRMDFVTAFGKAGLRRSGSFRHVVDITGCAIMQERSDELFKGIRPILLQTEGYDYLKHEGYLRYIVLRQGMFTGELMCNFVIAKNEERLDAVIDALYDRADSISIILQEGLADLSFGPVVSVVKNGTISESLGGMRFSIGPNSFFQSNSEIALAMYRRIREEARGRVLDLYSGVGSISLFIAGSVESVTGVESVDEAVAMAFANMVENKIENTRFVCADVLAFLSTSEERFDTVVCDPPRAGMHPAVLKQLTALAPERIVYMSCNPACLKNDLSMLPEYRLVSMEAWDMFPQTPHVEALAVLKRR